MSSEQKLLSCFSLDLGEQTLVLPVKILAEIARIPADWVDWQESGFPRKGQLSWQTEIIPCINFDKASMDSLDEAAQSRSLFAVIQFAPFCKEINFLAIKLRKRPKMFILSPEQYRYKDNELKQSQEWFIPLNPEPLVLPNFPAWIEPLLKLG